MVEPTESAYLALLQVGFAVAVFIAEAAVSSYLTVSPLPRSPVKETEAVCFLLHCP